MEINNSFTQYQKKLEPSKASQDRVWMRVKNNLKTSDHVTLNFLEIIKHRWLVHLAFASVLALLMVSFFILPSMDSISSESEKIASEKFIFNNTPVNSQTYTNFVHTTSTLGSSGSINNISSFNTTSVIKRNIILDVHDSYANLEPLLTTKIDQYQEYISYSNKGRIESIDALTIVIAADKSKEFVEGLGLEVVDSEQFMVDKDSQLQQIQNYQEELQLRRTTLQTRLYLADEGEKLKIEAELITIGLHLDKVNVFVANFNEDSSREDAITLRFEAQESLENEDQQQTVSRFWSQNKPGLILLLLVMFGATSFWAIFYTRSRHSILSRITN